jgi:hypothetical protein
VIGNMASANSIAKSNSKWKDALLKTSLPLEHLVAEKENRNLISGESFCLFAKMSMG